MKKDVHPNYELAIIRCACGSEVEIRTTQPGIAVEICSACHPFFTGKQKLMDAAGRVDRFRKRYNMEEAATTATVIARADDARKSKEAKTEPKRKKAEEAASRAAQKATPLKKPKIAAVEAEAPATKGTAAEAPAAETPDAETPPAES